MVQFNAFHELQKFNILFIRGISFIGLMVFASLFSGCAEKRPIEFTGYLDDYGSFEKKNDAQFFFEEVGVDWSKYHDVYIEPVVVRPQPNYLALGVQKNELVDLATYFEQQLQKSFSTTYDIAPEPKPGALYVRAAITDATPVSPWVNTLSTAATLMKFELGTTTVEFEILDAESFTRLYAAVLQKEGNPIDLTSGYTRWGHTKAALNDVAVEVRKMLKRS